MFVVTHVICTAFGNSCLQKIGACFVLWSLFPVQIVKVHRIHVSHNYSGCYFFQPSWLYKIIKTSLFESLLKCMKVRSNVF